MYKFQNHYCAVVVRKLQDGSNEVHKCALLNSRFTRKSADELPCWPFTTRCRCLKNIKFSSQEDSWGTWNSKLFLLFSSSVWLSDQMKLAKNQSRRGKENCRRGQESLLLVYIGETCLSNVALSTIVLRGTWIPSHQETQNCHAFDISVSLRATKTRMICNFSSLGGTFKEHLL